MSFSKTGKKPMFSKKSKQKTISFLKKKQFKNPSNEKLSNLQQQISDMQNQIQNQQERFHTQEKRLEFLEHENKQLIEQAREESKQIAFIDYVAIKKAVLKQMQQIHEKILNGSLLLVGDTLKKEMEQLMEQQKYFAERLVFFEKCSLMVPPTQDEIEEETMKNATTIPYARIFSTLSTQQMIEDNGGFTQALTDYASNLDAFNCTNKQ